MVAFRYWLTDGAEPEREVTMQEWVAAERAAGIYNTQGREDEPAKWGWSGGHMSGRLEYVTEARRR